MRKSIRAARKEDIPGILEMVKELADFEKLGHEVTATLEDFERSLFGEFAVAEALVAAEDDDSLMGYAIFFTTFSSFKGKAGIWLEDIYVRPQFRNRGIGRQFLFSIASIVKVKSGGRFEWSVLDWNQKAIDFYEKSGARILPDWRIVRMEDQEIEEFIHQ